jgi:hypothetical protein
MCCTAQWQHSWYSHQIWRLRIMVLMFNSAAKYRRASAYFLYWCAVRFTATHCVNVLISFSDIKHSLTFITIRSLFWVRYFKNRSLPQQFICVFSEQTPIIFLYGINRLVFITETVCGNVRHELNTKIFFMKLPSFHDGLSLPPNPSLSE